MLSHLYYFSFLGIFKCIPLLMSKLIGTFLSRTALAKLETESMDDISRFIHSIEFDGNPASSILLNSISLLGPSLHPNEMF